MTFRRYSQLLFVLSVLAIMVSAQPAGAESQDTELSRLRAERRQVARLQNLSAQKTDAPGRFGLLVIPVDFADARLPDDWNEQQLLPLLTPDSGEALHNYFRLASQGKLDLAITLAPLVHLADDRRLYSDRDLNGFTRTRNLATEAITAVRDLGLEFRSLDWDGPDGLPGTGDDDGQVDGVLILHAAPGTENDPEEGLIEPLQFFLAEPVVSEGVTASFYAVASLQSGPGIWAHETAHLLGLEDRYDPILPATGASEVHSVGGLGRFSLMSSGAWGTGGGYGAAMPDAYSCTQMGWRSMRNFTASTSEADTLRYGEAWRVWSGGESGPEFFLLETRNPVANAPFDAAVPANELLIYHVDENLAEGSRQLDGVSEWHLRVGLVEADADPQARLARGHNEGGVADLFPGSLAANVFGPASNPASDSYSNGPSGIALTEITSTDNGVHFLTSLDTEKAVAFEYEFVLVGAEYNLDLSVRETGVALASLRCEIQAVSEPAAGYFIGSGTVVADFSMVENEPGRWQPSASIQWHLIADISDDAQTEFRFVFYDQADVLSSTSRWWVWPGIGSVLDFKSQWPGEWVVEHPDGATGTSWHRWETAPWLTADETNVLVCAADEFATSAAWPAVTYSNNAHATLTSAALAPAITGVRMTHAIEVEMLTPVIAMDGGVVVWVGPDDVEVAAKPRGHYGGEIETRSGSPLHGQQAFVGANLDLNNDVPTWRTDTFDVPASGPGPWRLRLKFGANSLWRARGWYVAELEAITSTTVDSDFYPTWNTALTWNWPWHDSPADPVFAVETRTDDTSPWVEILARAFTPDTDQKFSVPAAEILQALDLTAEHRHQVRVVGQRPAGVVASPAVVVYPDCGARAVVRISQPWPNPFSDTVRFLLDVPAGRVGVLYIFDVRGRLVHTKEYAAGQQLISWDGRDRDGAGLAAGHYYLRLEGTGSVFMRKVVLIH